MHGIVACFHLCFGESWNINYNIKSTKIALQSSYVYKH